MTPVGLRVTSIFCREDDAWKILHRHADPITTPRSGESVLQSYPDWCCGPPSTLLQS
jgi:hypothetical protein